MLKLAGPGSYIGIQTILADRVHQYSATCVKPSRICYIDIYSFKELLKRNRDFSFEMIIYLCKDELRYFDRIAALSSRQVHGRLAYTILHLADLCSKDGRSYEIPLSRLEIASMINTSRESVSRALRELQESGMIKMEQRKLEILSRDGLGKISRNC